MVYILQLALFSGQYYFLLSRGYHRCQKISFLLETGYSFLGIIFLLLFQKRQLQLNRFHS